MKKNTPKHRLRPSATAHRFPTQSHLIGAQGCGSRPNPRESHLRSANCERRPRISDPGNLATLASKHHALISVLVHFFILDFLAVVDSNGGRHGGGTSGWKFLCNGVKFMLGVCINGYFKSQGVNVLFFKTKKFESLKLSFPQKIC